MSLYTDSSGSVPHSNDTVESVEIKTTKTSNDPHSSIVNEYEIGKSLGKGHFGQVKLAHRFTTGEMCALKIIEHKANFSPRQQELFQR
jgi:serine/threonine protein kinase